MARISKADVNGALERAAQRIIDAAGPDKRVSRADLEGAVAALEGTEKKLVDVFFKFIDHRDHEAGATVTAKDVHKALAYAKEKLVAQYDVNGNGLSKGEIEKMSLTGKLAVQLARELKAQVVQPEPSPAPSADGFVQDGMSFYELREGVTIDSHQRFNAGDEVSDLMAKQFIAACGTSTYDHVKTLAEAHEAVDGGEFVVRTFTDPQDGKQYVAVDYGAGDSTYGALFEQGSAELAFAIKDGELYRASAQSGQALRQPASSEA